MGRLFLVDLEFEEPYHTIIVCSTCHTHISHYRYVIYYVQLEEDGVHDPFFSNVVNVQDTEKLMEIGQWTLYKVYCVKCGEQLGGKYIYKDVSAEGLNNDESVSYYMYTTKLSLWNENVFWGPVYPYQLPPLN